jgi:predicted helicase
MRHFLAGQNVGLTLCRQFKTGNEYHHARISSNIIESSFVSNRTSEITSFFPLYLYQGQSGQTGFAPNLDMETVKKIAAGIGLAFNAGAGAFQKGNKSHFTPIDLLDYIYAVLHSPSYREKYREFLKIDFPRVPYPADAAEFRRLAKLGEELRLLHLMEHPALDKPITGYPVGGSDTVEKLRWEPDKNGSTGRAWINGTQYFDRVPLVAWEFYIGGYQPAQKWLKDRKGRRLAFEDIEHYQKIITALEKTDEIMRSIDN